MSDIEIPNMVKEVIAEFGYEIKLYMLGNGGPQGLDRVVGLKQVRNTVYIRQIKVDDARRPIVNKELDVFESEIITEHKHLLLVTDGSGVDITEKFLEFAEKTNKKLEKWQSSIIYPRIVKIIAPWRILDKEIKLTDTLRENLKLDNLELLEIILAIEESFKIEIHDELFETFKTVQDIVDLVTKLTGAKNG